MPGAGVGPPHKATDGDGQHSRAGGRGMTALGTLYVVKGVQAVVVGPRRINADQLPDAIVHFGRDAVLGVPYLLWLALLAGVAGAWFLRTVRTGRDLYAVGSNPPAARLVGIPV